VWDSLGRTIVPYRGTTALLPDLLANRISMSFANIVNVLPLAREGKLRALAITSIKRSALAPELPTMAESGFPGFEAVPWFGLLAPMGTPQDVLDQLHGQTVKTLAMPRARKVRRTRPRAGRQHAGRVYRDHQERNARMGQSHQGCRHQARQLAFIRIAIQ
jgi:tripartite-type tricarboxylate transporter receptor subunit TctC